MGYYTGGGVVAGGGETTSTLKSFYWYQAYSVRQKCVSATVRKAGVSLATAQASHESCNLTPVGGGSGTMAWIIYDAEGTRKKVSYSQIGDSNLYELEETTETLTASLAGGTVRSL